ncbi:12607_t:CDS:1, partial [Cetraspora pellucida]
VAMNADGGEILQWRDLATMNLILMAMKYSNSDNLIAMKCSNDGNLIATR